MKIAAAAAACRPKPLPLAPACHLTVYCGFDVKPGSGQRPRLASEEEQGVYHAVESKGRNASSEYGDMSGWQWSRHYVAPLGTVAPAGLTMW